MSERGLIRLSESSPSDTEVTVYVKGFLARGEDPDHFGAWLSSHRAMAERGGWGARALGYRWPSGRIDGVPLPVLTSARVAWDLYRVLRGAGRLNVATHVGWFAGEEAALLAARFVGQYMEAARTARERSEELAGELRVLTESGARVRVVAHSLGCLQVIEAVSSLPADHRPFSVHLCAPACREDGVASKLATLASERTRLYYTAADFVLEAAFRVMSWGRALGAVGPSGEYEGVTAVDVGEHFGFWVHGEYKNRFAEFASRLP